ncbi:hypothetical protein RhiLY_09171 [Ceratobasidium sp. AG-Ba]|nr:hypothetical protein RhiLY_09171 [Ceratobasidium sp. AG-Ba]
MTQTTITPSSMSRFFTIPELVATIFSAAAPLVWKHVQGVHHVLALLPGVSVSRFVNRSVGIIKIHIAEIDILVADRFKLYAPFVKSLNVGGHYQVDNCDTLLNLSRQCVLLPNLSSLSQDFGCYNCNWDMVLWVRLFASESLIHTWTVPSDPRRTPRISLNAFDLILQWLLEHCPRLQSISLFPSRAPQCTGRTGHIMRLHGVYRTKEFDAYLTPDLMIREIACSWDVLENRKTLMAMGKLLRLERLVVYHESYYDDHDSSEGSEAVLSQTPLPSDAFSALRSLSIYAYSDEYINLTLDQCSLSRNIVYLELNIFADDTYKPLAEHSFLSRLSGLHCLKHLVIKFSWSPYDPSSQAIDDHEKLYEAFHQLQLENLYISHLDLDFAVLPGHLNSMWSRIIDLRLPGTEVGLNALPVFALLPALCHLTVRLSLDITSLGDTIPVVHTGERLHTLEGSYGSTARYEKKDARRIVQ